MIKPKKGKRNDPRKGVKREKYNIPDELDVKLKREKVESLGKTLLEGNKAKPTTDNQIKQLFRSAVRLRWMHYPCKLAFLESKATPDYDENTRRLWKWQCNQCKGWFNKGEVEVDHIKGGGRDFETMCDAPEYARGILDISFDDLQILCSDKQRGCHVVKSHSEVTGLSFEDARLDKQAIQWEKDNKGVAKQRSVLTSLGVVDADKLKGKDIRKAYFNYLKQNNLSEIKLK